MAERQFVVSAVLRARDLLSRPVLGAAKNVDTLNRAAAQVNGAQATARATTAAATAVRGLGTAAILGAGALNPLVGQVQGVEAATAAAVQPVAAVARSTESYHRAVDKMIDRGGLVEVARQTDKVEKATRAANGTLRDAQGKFIRAGDAAQGAVGPLKGAERGIDGVGRAGDRAKKKVDGVTAALKSLRSAGDGLQNFGGTSSGAGAAITAMLAGPVMAFSNLEDAQTRAGVAFLTAAGQDPLFGQVEQTAIRLGTLLPGTTRDVLEMAAALKEAGTSTQSILGGGLEASAYARVLLDQTDPASAGRMMATFRQSLGVADGDMVRLVDLIQRGKFGFGMDPTEFAMGVKYVAPVAKRLNLGGLENSRSMVAMAGQLSQSGIRGEQLGTSLRAAFLKLPEVEAKAGSSKSAAGKILRDAGINLDFFDKKGEFVGIEGFIGQLEKLQKLNPERQMAVFGELFGTEATPMLMELASRGVKGHRDALAVLDQQASLQQRTDRVLGSFRSVWEAATGTLENTAAAVGATMDGDLKRWSAALNQNAEKVGAWVEANEPAVRSGVKVAAASAAVALALGGTSLALGTTIKLFTPLVGGMGRAWQGAKLLRAGFMGVTPTGNAAARALMWVGAEARKTGPRLTDLSTSIRTTAGATRDWTAAKLAHGRVLVVRQINAWSSALTTVPGRLRAVATGIRGVTRAQVLAKLAHYALAAAQGIATAAQWALNTAMYANPIGVVVAAVVAAVAVIVAAAFLIWKYWKPLMGFLTGFWRGFIAATKPIGGILRALWVQVVNTFAPLRPILARVVMAVPALRIAFMALGLGLRAVRVAFGWVATAVRGVIGWFKSVLKPVDDVGGKAENMGERIGTAVGNVLVFVAGLPSKFLTAGTNIVTSLYNGMKSMADKPVELMRRIAQRVRNLLPFSPAKDGPLRDIHRIRLVETIAAGIRPGPMVNAMRAATAATLAAVSLASPGRAFALPAPTLDPLRAAAEMYDLPGTGSGGGGPAVVFAPVFAPELRAEAGVDAAVVDRLERQVATMQREFERWARDQERRFREERTALAPRRP